VDKSVRCLCQIFLGFNVPKIIKIGQFFDRVIQKIKRWTFLGDTGYYSPGAEGLNFLNLVLSDLLDFSYRMTVAG